MNLVQAGNWVSGSDLPHDMDKGIDVAVVKDKVVVHRMDREQEVESVERPVQVIHSRFFPMAKETAHTRASQPKVRKSKRAPQYIATNGTH